MPNLFQYFRNHMSLDVYLGKGRVSGWLLLGKGGARYQ